MSAASDMRHCLVECDVAAARKLWHQLAPKAPAPKTDEEALQCIHYARTLTVTISPRLRAYSHYWLSERGLPSGLPDDMRKKAERLYPHVVEAVGHSYNVRGALMQPLKPIIQGAMQDAILECYADGKTKPAIVLSRMNEARDRTKRKLLGIISEAAKKDLLKQ